MHRVRTAVRMTTRSNSDGAAAATTAARRAAPRDALAIFRRSSCASGSSSTTSATAACRSSPARLAHPHALGRALARRVRGPPRTSRSSATRSSGQPPAAADRRGRQPDGTSRPRWRRPSASSGRERTPPAVRFSDEPLDRPRRRSRRPDLLRDRQAAARSTRPTARSTSSTCRTAAGTTRARRSSRAGRRYRRSRRRPDGDTLRAEPRGLAHARDPGDRRRRALLRRRPRGWRRTAAATTPSAEHGRQLQPLVSSVDGLVHLPDAAHLHAGCRLGLPPGRASRWRRACGGRSRTAPPFVFRDSVR